MDISIEVDLGQAARELNLPVENVQSTVTLLDEGNTVPFITRYRKHQTGTLDEEQIRRIQEKVGKLRGLVERKQTILRSLQSQGVLAPELAEQIRHATSLKRLEDLYLPYKPKKQTLATAARQRGLEPLALEVMGADPAAADLHQRAELLIDPEKELSNVDDVLQGVQHIIAERYSERADVRGRLRKILRRSGRLVCSRIENPKQEVTAAGDTATPVAGQEPEPAAAAPPAAENADVPPPLDSTEEPAAETAIDPAAEGMAGAEPGVATAGDAVGGQDDSDSSVAALPPVEAASETGSAPADSSETVSTTGEPGPASPDPAVDESAPPESAPPESAPPESAPPESAAEESAPPESAAEESAPPDPASVEPASVEPAAFDPAPSDPSATQGGEEVQQHASPDSPSPESEKPEPQDGPTPAAPEAIARPSVAKTKSAEKKGKRGSPGSATSKKEKKRQRLEAAFKDYYEFHESVSRIPPHRVLAINRGERSRILRVKMDADMEAMAAESEALLIEPEDHPHGEFLKGCIRDALSRLLLPSLERELRREMTEKAEEHAVEVFARNLRKLLLQPPVHHHRVLAIDPGFRSGCKLIALDEFGNVLNHEIIHVIGKEEWIRKGRAKLVGLVQRHQLSVVAIGNGAACRETEQLVVDVMKKELKEQDVAFVIVNEAGASVYSTSPLGREELPTYDAVLRSAISIGRRLLDPLSELVKINPANIGVGMYQHDVKAKHLRTSLDAVVESCVNYVGVDVNTASPALLRYVSGMNQLTARRLCEYRASHGPFRNREDLKQVPGLGDATFVQAAGFLKITNGDNPLDRTWIHPESYDLARRVLDAAHCDVEDLRPSEVPDTASGAAAANQFGRSITDPAAATPKPNGDESASVEPATPEPATPEPATPEPATPEPAAPEPAASEPAEPAATEPAATEPAATEPVIREESAESVEREPPSVAVAEAETTTDDLEQGLTVEEPTTTSETEAVNLTGDVGGEVTETGTGPELIDASVPEGAALPEAAVPEEAAVAETPTADSSEAIAERLRLLYEKVHQLDVASLVDQWSVNRIVLQDVLNSLARPGRDPREDLPAPVFRRGIVKLEDLEPAMRLSGTVLNVVDFGAFVDIGLSDSGLIHISRLADRFVRDPHEVVGVGDVLTVWVVDIDKQRRRVSLTAIEPGTEKPPESRRRSDKPRSEKPRSRRPSDKRPHAGKGPRDERGRGKGRPARDKAHKSRPRKPKVIKPITKEMEEGTEPLRSFSDLMQFYQKKQGDEDESKP